MDIEVDVNSSDNTAAFEIDSLINCLDCWLFLGYIQHTILDLLLQGLRTLFHLVCDDGKRTDKEDLFLIVFEFQSSLVLDDPRF